MAVIVQRNFSTWTPKKGIALYNEDLVIPLGFSSWTSLRIGVLFSIGDSGGGNLTTAKFVFGLCSSTSQPFGDASCPNFLGCSPHYMVNSSGGTLTYAAGYYTSGNQCAFKKVSGVESGNSHFNGSTVYDMPVTGRSAAFMDITKGSPNYTIYCASSSATTSWNPGWVNQEMQWHLVPGVFTTSGGTMQSLYGQGFAADESTGTLTNLNIYWNKTIVPLEIYHVAVMKFA